MTSTAGGGRGFGTFRPTPAPGAGGAAPRPAGPHVPPSSPPASSTPPAREPWSVPGGSGGPSPWWARSRSESPAPLEPCPRQTSEGGVCGAPAESPFDVYCQGREAHFLVLGGARRTQVAAVNGARATLGVLVVLAAAHRTPVPLYAVAALLGLLVLVPPMRLFRVSRIVAAVLWLGALGLAAAVHQGWIAGGVRDAVVLATLAVVLAALVAAVLVAGGSDVATRPLALALSAALALVVAAALLSLGVGGAGGALRRTLWLTALAALGSALGGAALAGFVRGVRRVHYRPPTIRRPRLTPPRLRRPSAVRMSSAASRTPAARLAATVRATVVGVARQLAATGAALLTLVYAVVNGIAYATLRIAATVRARLAWLVRLLAEAARAAAVSLVEAARLVGAVALRWARSSLLPVAVVGAGAEGALLASRSFSAYLDGASLARGVGGLALAVAVAAVLVVLWWALTGWPADVVLDAALRSVAFAGPSAFLTLVVLGWATGLAGLVGAGPLRPGVLTYAGTVVLIASSLWVWATGEREAAGSGERA